VTSEIKSTVEILANANLSNIGKKLKAGKTLTSSERKAINEFATEQINDGWVKDTTTLSKELGLSRQAIYDARSRYPNAPQKHEDGKRENLTAWQEFCAENLIGKDVATKSLSELKAEIMQRDIYLRDLKIKREKGDVIDAVVVEEMMSTLSQKLDLLLRLKLEVELGSRLAGKDAADINIEGGVILDEIREVINNNIATFKDTAIRQSQKIDIPI
jgi:hypothetical protein